MDEHAFPPTGFAVAWLGYSLHNFQNPSEKSVAGSFEFESALHSLAWFCTYSFFFFFFFFFILITGRQNYYSKLGKNNENHPQKLSESYTHP